MAFIPSIKKLITQREVQGGAAVSQSTWNKIGGMINFIGTRSHQEKAFYINGYYGSVSVPYNAIDGLAFFEFDAEIFNVWVFGIKAGDADITELDLKVKPKDSGAFASIFSTTPKFSPLAGDDVFFEIGDVKTGVTAPVLVGGGSYNVNRGDAIRLDLIGRMSGQARSCGVVIHYRPR